MQKKRAPNNLKTHGKAFWKKVMAEYVLEDSHDLERLTHACSCLDTIDEAEKIVAKEGYFINDRFQQRREHPGLKTIRDNKVVFCRIIRELRLDLETGPDNRPPRQY